MIGPAMGFLVTVAVLLLLLQGATLAYMRGIFIRLAPPEPTPKPVGLAPQFTAPRESSDPPAPAPSRPGRLPPPPRAR